MFLLIKSLNNIVISPGFMRLIVFGVFEQDLVHVSGRVLEQFVARVKDDECDLTIAQHRQFICLFHQTELAFCESNLSVAFIRDARDLDLLAPHIGDVGGFG